MKSKLVCLRCGGIVFNSSLVYIEHMRNLHDLKLALKIMPEKLTERTHAQIVIDIENAIAQDFIGAGFPNPIIS